MSDSNDFAQRWLEWRYGLLSDEEGLELLRELAEHPELAQQLAESQRLADLFKAAAKLPDQVLPAATPATVEERSGEQANVSPVAPPIQPPAPTVEPTAEARPVSQWTVNREVPTATDKQSPKRRWRPFISIALAGLYLVCLLGGEEYFRWLERVPPKPVAERKIAPNQIRLSIEQVSAAVAGSETQVQVQAQLSDGRTTPISLSSVVQTADGRVLFAAVGATDAVGRCLFKLPKQLKIPEGSQLHVTADSRLRPDRVEIRAIGTIRLVPTRHLTHLSLDKTLYRPGDTIRFRSLTLERFSLKADQEMPLHFEVRDPNGTVVPNSVREGLSSQGVGAGEFAIPVTQVGGEYSLVCSSPEKFFPDEIRKFHIQAYRVPRLKKELEFQKDSYGPGDVVIADFVAKKAEGGPSAEAQLRVTAEVDGATIAQQTLVTDATGAAHLEVTLPTDIRIGDGHLSVAIDDGGTRETLTKTIPIQLDRIDVAFYPASGDLVPGLENKVYFVGRNPQGKPVHIAGKIVDSRGREITTTETEHEGMGRFAFTPEFATSYRLVLTKPEGLRATFDLPVPNAAQAVVIDAGSGIVPIGENPELTVFSAQDLPNLLLTAYCRGTLVGQTTFAARQGGNAVSLPLIGDASGVLRVTVHDNSVQPPKPLAERLIFRRHGRELRVAVKAQQPAVSPGERARLDLSVTNERGEPVPAALGLAVVDDSVLVLTDDKYPTLRTHFLVTSEVSSPEDLEDADFYLSADPESERALDLLLGTQGWRRFVEKRLVDLQADPVLREQVRRLQALGGVTADPTAFTNEANLLYLVATNTSLDGVRSTFRAILAILGVILLCELFFTLLFARSSGTGLKSLMLVICVSAPVIWGCGEAQHDRAPAASAKPASADAMRTAPSSAPAADADAPPQFAEGMPSAKDEASEGAPPAEAPSLAAPAGAVPMNGDPKADQAHGFLFPGRNGPADVMPPRQGQAGPPLPQSPQFFRFIPQDLVRFRDGHMTPEEQAQKTCVLREYSHRQRQRRSTERSDFTETVYWNPLLVTDAQGRAAIEFDASDSITTFRVTANAHAKDGRLGTGLGEVVSRRAFYLEPKLPLEVTVGDRIQLPVAVVNGSAKDFAASVALAPQNLLAVTGKLQRDLSLPAGQRTRELYELDVKGLGDVQIALTGTAGEHRDSVRRAFKSVSQGFPISESLSGSLVAGDSMHGLRLPEKWVPGSLSVELKLFPNRFVEAQQSLSGLLREPGGCFEQTSSSNYPNTMVLRLLGGDQPANASEKLTEIRRAKEMLQRGYARLTGYESKSGGFEWFGGDPGHEALTAFGLMQFHDMAPVFPVDSAMLDRTAKWLLARRDGQGRFKINPRYLHNWGAPAEVLNAYIVWALTETKDPSIRQQLSLELATVRDLSMQTRDPYVLALCAASLANAELFDAADSALSRLIELRRPDGSLEGATTVTVSGGEAKVIETTALAVLAWQKRPAFAEAAASGVNWLRSKRTGAGHFGSTQATVLALKAVLGSAPVANSSSTSPIVSVRLADREVARLDLSAMTSPAVMFDPSVMRGGLNELRVTNATGNAIPFAFDVRYFTDRPNSDDRCPLRLSTKLATEKTTAGSVVMLQAKLTNTKDTGLPMSMVALGIPAGLEVRAKQLDELKDKGLFDYYELKPREVICYWRNLQPAQEIDLALELTAEIPGTYTGPASRTWLYYTAEQKQWIEPLKIEISP